MTIKHPVRVVATEKATLILNCDIIVHSLITEFGAACCCPPPPAPVGGGLDNDGYASAGLGLPALTKSVKIQLPPLC